MSFPDDERRPPLSRRLHWWALAFVLAALVVATLAEGGLHRAVGRPSPARAASTLHGLARPSVEGLFRRLERPLVSRRSAPPAASVHARPRPIRPRDDLSRRRRRRQRKRRRRKLPGARAAARASPILAFRAAGAISAVEDSSDGAGLRDLGSRVPQPSPLLPIPHPVGLWPETITLAPSRGRGETPVPRRRREDFRPGPRTHVLLPGTAIPAVLLTRLVSDLPGLVEARTSRAVYGSVHERTLLIPPGSLLVGHYGATVHAGARRLFVSFDRIEFPDGAGVRLPGMEAAGVRGASGLHDLVRTHFWRMFGSSFLVAGLGALLPGNTNRILILPSGAPLVAGTVTGEALDRAAQTVLDRDRDLPPTIVIRRGTRFNVLVARTIRFPAAALAVADREQKKDGW
jgi:hypothetical protein